MNNKKVRITMMNGDTVIMSGKGETPTILTRGVQHKQESTITLDLIIYIAAIVFGLCSSFFVYKFFGGAFLAFWAGVPFVVIGIGGIVEDFVLKSQVDNI